ncbi:GDP-mannose 4,6-dehydratase [Nocardioides lianchengensis]|uniref:GDP-mannose 4,6-dehydratase n=1 Tax=Nocardioides lianchengensis TaxID=1045774 RepID=A0A1G7AX68_9ACTN|nr:GDP-mannose 4,6-dehydratase [Nocardioides lianchengensis]NYG13327.1 GDPmannose 4,6-dehydratase [Nocardioides lianchengensis]SDE19167.1 GDPmannose 4,6-dehydratase [Nocardioides lianchengensis]
MPRAFITGISGQDGSYLSERLVAEGYDVHALAFSSEPTPSSPGVVLHCGDLTDIDRVRSLVVEIAPDEIYNLAAISSVARSWQEPDLTARINGLAAVGLLESALQAQEATGNAVRFVQASSAEIFGEPAHSPQDEHTPLRPVNPYGAAKAYAHLMTGVYRGRGLHAVSAILYNHESPRRPAQFVTRKITAGAAAIARGEADSISLGNLDARRDWGWAPDYVDALVRAARADRADDYVIATGQSRSVREFVAAAFAKAGVSDWERHVRVDPAFVRPADPSDLTGDSSRARKQLGWRPTTSFEEIVGRMVEADLSQAD